MDTRIDMQASENRLKNTSSGYDLVIDMHGSSGSAGLTNSGAPEVGWGDNDRR